MNYFNCGSVLCNNGISNSGHFEKGARFHRFHDRSFGSKLSLMTTKTGRPTSNHFVEISQRPVSVKSDKILSKI